MNFQFLDFLNPLFCINVTSLTCKAWQFTLDQVNQFIIEANLSVNAIKYYTLKFTVNTTVPMSLVAIEIHPVMILYMILFWNLCPHFNRWIPKSSLSSVATAMLTVKISYTVSCFVDCHGCSTYDFSFSFGCDLLIKPTHISPNSSDLVFSDLPSMVSTSVGVYMGTSDHCLFTIKIDVNQHILNCLFKKTACLKTHALIAERNTIGIVTILKSENVMQALNHALAEACKMTYTKENYTVLH